MGWMDNTYGLQLITIKLGFDASPRNKYVIQHYDENGNFLGTIPTLSSLGKVKGHMRTLARKIEEETDHSCKLDFKGPVRSGKISLGELISRGEEKEKSTRRRKNAGF